MTIGDLDFDADEILRSCWLQEGGVSEPEGEYTSPFKRRNPVVDETFDLASAVMDYCERLEPVNRIFADQILRCGTSVGSHTREAQGAESLADFFHKMKIAMKELEETDFRPALCHRRPHYPHDTALVERTKRLFPLFHSILSTTRQRINDKKK